MEKPDYIEEKFRQSFSEFTVAPPGRVWDGLQKILHPKPVPERFWARISDLSWFSPPTVKRLVFISSATVVLFLFLVYFMTSNNHAIRGHAYDGESRLCGGTAILYRIQDSTVPLDSVNHYRTEMVDDNGFFQFPDVDPGRYLLHIFPQGHKGLDENLLPSSFDWHKYAEQTEIIIISTDDVNADVHLPPKENLLK